MPLYNKGRKPIGFYIMSKRLRIALISLVVIVVILCTAIAILIKNANRIIKYELESILGKNFSVKNIELRCGKIEASDISLRSPAGREVFKIEGLTLEADFIALLRKEYTISALSMKNPYLFLEIDPKGNLVNPFLQKRPKKKRVEKPTPPVFIKKIKITNGSLDYLDRKVSTPPVITRLRDIELEFKGLAFPFNERFSTYTVTAQVLGNLSTGIIKSNGKIKLKTKDTDCRIDLKGLDITKFKPYFQKKGDVNVTKGILDLLMDIEIKSRKINAPGRAVFKDLKFERRPGMGNKFLSIPLSALINFLKNNNNEIVVDFILEGDLDNPKFSLKESLLEEITLSLAEKLGLSVTRIGESIVELGAEGAKQIEKGVKGVGEGIRKILER
jgi:hypothetical protein